MQFIAPAHETCDRNIFLALFPCQCVPCPDFPCTFPPLLLLFPRQDNEDLRRRLVESLDVDLPLGRDDDFDRLSEQVGG